jgi:hypothetical protein
MTKVGESPAHQPTLLRSRKRFRRARSLEKERKVKAIATVPEVVRIIVSDYFKKKSET